LDDEGDCGALVAILGQPIETVREKARRVLMRLLLRASANRAALKGPAVKP